MASAHVNCQCPYAEKSGGQCTEPGIKKKGELMLCENCKTMPCEHAKKLGLQPKKCECGSAKQLKKECANQAVMKKEGVNLCKPCSKIPCEHVAEFMKMISPEGCQCKKAKLHGLKCNNLPLMMVEGTQMVAIECNECREGKCKH
jgi:hypothetical protein